MTAYGSVIHDHSRNPRNYGSLDEPDLRREEVNPLCGDRVRIELAVRDGVVEAARFRGDLCTIAKAATSLLTVAVIGMKIDDVREFPEERLFAALEAEIPRARRQCALLPLQVLRMMT
jgi:nitrogen fixation protein NifU and related proteins